MKKILISCFVVMLVLASLPILSNAAETNSNEELLYQQGIAAGAIDKEKTTYSKWENENKDLKANYDSGIRDGFLKDTPYEEWLAQNNYGQEPKDLNNAEVKSFRLQANSLRSGFKVKPGDIFITNSTSSHGISGHAAIANGANHILDMPGTGAGKPPQSNNNRQSTVNAWIKKYNKGWIKVYRLKDSKLAAKVAKYADGHYYSSKHTSQKTIKIPYAITSRLYNIKESYCSKLVFDAYYFGSGKENVMVPASGYVYPYMLIGKFWPDHLPIYVHKY